MSAPAWLSEEPTGFCRLGQHHRCDGNWHHLEGPGIPVELVPCACDCHSRVAFEALAAVPTEGTVS